MEKFVNYVLNDISYSMKRQTAWNRKAKIFGALMVIGGSLMVRKIKKQQIDICELQDKVKDLSAHVDELKMWADQHSGTKTKE